jgi:L-2-hydroxyglutarate oxidase LhgO
MKNNMTAHDHAAEIVILGAGIVGLTLARELVRRGANDILVVDKEGEQGLHASGRNSGVLHAGIYYAPGSTRARLCLKGNLAMREYCEERGLAILKRGKVIVARSDSEIPALLELHKRALANGAAVELIDARQLAALEPNARTAGQALHSPQTAQVDPKEVLRSLTLELGQSGKVRFLFGAAFLSALGPRAMRTTRGRVAYDTLVNAAGAHSDKVARYYGAGQGYQLVPFKGLYKKLKAEHTHLVQGNIYPVPDIRNPFLGVHFTRSVHGDAYIGPTAIPAFGRENYGVLKGIDAEALPIAWRDAVLFFRNPKFRSVALTEPRKYFFQAFFNDARKLVRQLEPEWLENSPKVGIRPQLVDTRTNEMVMDFVVEKKGSGVHVLNAISPAFTSSLAFAEMVAEKFLA